jgi:serine/threonine protein kinase
MFAFVDVQEHQYFPSSTFYPGDVIKSETAEFGITKVLSSESAFVTTYLVDSSKAPGTRFLKCTSPPKKDSFENEVAVLKALNGRQSTSPHFPRLEDHFSFDYGDVSLGCIVMTFASEGDLSDTSGLSDQQKRGLILQMAEAIRDLHAARYIHGDLTSRTFVRTAEGTVLMIDFKSARRAGSRGMRNQASDLRSLGVIAFELYEGRQCDLDELVKHHRMIPFTETPEVLRRLITDLLTLNPEGRITAEKVIEQMAELYLQ